jgi:uncharacterized membrane protein
VRRRFSLIALVAVAVAWNTALIASPLVASPYLSAFTYASGSLVCHQQSARSFHLAGAQLPVCARCFGLYAGAVFGIVAWCALAGLARAARPRAAQWVNGNGVRVSLIAVAVPTVVSVALAWLGLWDGTNLTRALLALPLGAVLALVMAAVAAGDLR